MPPEEFSKGDILVINYGLGNIGSLVNALRFLGFNYQVIENRQDFCAEANIVGCIVPGVGAFDHGMKQLIERKLDMLIKDLVQSQVQVLGICLGMQMLVDESEESARKCQGLGLIPGYVSKLNKSNGKVPHMGWTRTFAERPKSREKQKAGIEIDADFYYVHSYSVVPNQPYHTIASFNHGNERRVAAVQSGNILGVQFHPEKSQQAGLQLFLEYFGNPQ